jgi:hypothetical protein
MNFKNLRHPSETVSARYKRICAKQRPGPDCGCGNAGGGGRGGGRATRGGS